mmetsp:Transcript_1886/g.4288  ORF Transcript_1886/g.4288 Transcript_1886/m.4288 type:complete len:222 (+) Transcript_1886:996-1661(+)
MTPSSACPRCSECPEEDYLHVPRCRGPTAIAEWSKRHQNFRTWLVAHHTAPEIEVFLFEYLKTVRQPLLGAPAMYIHSLNRTLFERAKRSQASLGAQGLLEGLISKEWRQLQRLHYVREGSQKSADLWASRLVQQLLLLGHYMWQDRNQVYHSEDNVRYKARRREVDLSIREQYAMGNSDLPPRIQQMLRTPVPPPSPDLLKTVKDGFASYLANAHSNVDL